MLPEKNCGESARDQAERQSNYLILSSLEQKLPPELFRQILTEIQGSMKLPGRLTWAGQKSESSFTELKMAQGHLNAGFLTSMLQAVSDLQKRSGSKDSQIAKANNLQTLLKQTSARHQFQKTSLYAKVHPKPGRMTATLRKEVQLAEFFKFKRMKTVFCHADHSTDEVSSIFNVQFDRTGRFVISGADDGILKIWDRDTLTLQASLHGHLDFITDIDISKCNRFIASAGKDAQVIIWDLKMGRVVKRMTSHSSLINRLLFVAPRVPAQQGAPAGQPVCDQPGSLQTVRAFAASSDTGTDTAGLPSQNDGENPGGPVSSYIKDQFLLTCSDDGTVRLYDFSPLSRVVDGANGAGSQQSTTGGGSRHPGNSQQQKSDYDEMRVRRSGRRSANATTAAQQQLADGDQEVFIFEVELTPDDYRPGTRNKKLDAVACSSAGIVVAGTSTGEIFCWKLNFTDIARRNHADCYKYIGQFKICKNAGVQFAEFSPINDLLMTGSTDGSVKIWRLDIPTGKSLQQQVLKTFSMNDDSRLVVTIDERNGCIKTNSISYFDEDGAENFEYVPVKQPISGQIGFSKSGKEAAAIKFSKSQCDAIKWSVRGRFAIASITSQIEDPRNEVNMAQAEEFKEEVCRIKIWDTVNETFYDDLARPCGHQLKKNSWVLAPHPIFEELLMTGSDGGTLILWNIEKKQIIQRFSQYGVYSIDGYVRDNPLDGKFSCDGKAFIVGNQLGTISLFSCEANVEHQYEATRVQQFFLYDRARNSANPFERIENRPQICGYNMIPHEAQPARPLIGRFLSDEFTQTQQSASQALVLKQAADHKEEEEKVPAQESKEQQLEKRKADARAFERKLITAKELGHLEEKYYQHQLSNCLQDSYQPNVLEQGNQLDAFIESSIDPGEGGRERIESGYDEQSLVNALSPPPRRSGHSTGRAGGMGAFEGQSSASINMRSRAHQASGGQRRSVGQPNDVMNGASGAQGARQGGRRRIMRRQDRALRDNPVVNGYDDSEELIVADYRVNGEVASPQSLYHEDSENEDSASDASDMESSPEVVRQRFQVRRTNIHDQQHAMQGYMEEDRANRRTARLNRRNERREPPNVTGESGTTSGRRTGRGNEINIDLDMDDDLPQRRRGRGRPSNAERERLRQFQERSGGHHRRPQDSRHRRIIDDDEDDDSDEDQSDDNDRRQLRARNRRASGGATSQQVSSQANYRSHRNAGSTQEENNHQTLNNRGSMRRNARRIIENSSNSRSMMGEDAHMTEERKGVSPTKAEKTHNQVIRESGYFLSDREDASAFNFDMLQSGGANDHGDSHEKEQKIKRVMSSVADPPGTQPDEDYNLIESTQNAPSVLLSQKKCSFCQKADKPLVGPFCKYDKQQQSSNKLVGQPLFFHQDCIEYNQYSKFSLESKKWVNIGKALNNLVHNEQFSCYRCQTKGATVQCRDCNKAFHGFKCARMYTLQLIDDVGNVFYQCVFCRNTQNWEDRVSELTDKEVERQELEREGLLHEKSYLKKLSMLHKQHLLSSLGFEKQQVEALGQTYNPQVNDFVYYFFQGHEYFMTQFSCHHFCGQQQNFARKRFMPWYKHPKLRKREFVRCKVDCVEVLFPSQRSLNLISMYGENSTQVTQTSEIVQRMTLSVIESTSGSATAANISNSIKFQVDIFPNQLPDFLVPQAIFTEKYEKYVKALESGAMVEKTFKVYLKDQNTIKTMRIVSGNSPVEPTLYPSSLWQNIKCVDANPGRSGYGRVTEMPQHRSTRSRGGGAPAVNSAGVNETSFEEEECERVSFWDIQFGGTDEIQNIAKSMHVFIREEKTKLVNTLQDFIEKKREYIEVFLERVPIELAPDYRSIIPSEMFFNLIKNRINNCYYRSQEQLLSDIDLISYNAKIYNGEHHDISLNAKELCEIIRVKLKQTMFTKSDKLMQQQIEQAGKLTGPARTRAAFLQKVAANENQQTSQQQMQQQNQYAEEESKVMQIEIPASAASANAAQAIQQPAKESQVSNEPKKGGESQATDGQEDQVMVSAEDAQEGGGKGDNKNNKADGKQEKEKRNGTSVGGGAPATSLVKSSQASRKSQQEKIALEESPQQRNTNEQENNTLPVAQPSATDVEIVVEKQGHASQPIEEEKKNPAGIVRINIAASSNSNTHQHQHKSKSNPQSNKNDSSQHMMSMNAGAVGSNSTPAGQAIQQQAKNQINQTQQNSPEASGPATMVAAEEVKPSERPNRRGAPSQKQSEGAAAAGGNSNNNNRAGTASNNMSRRRNRINANLLTAEELEDKTKTEAAMSTDPIIQQQTENNDERRPPATQQPPQQQMQEMRVTRNNLRKRQKNE